VHAFNISISALSQQHFVSQGLQNFTLFVLVLARFENASSDPAVEHAQPNAHEVAFA
jgi:hypothetical protein